MRTGREGGQKAPWARSGHCCQHRIPEMSTPITDSTPAVSQSALPTRTGSRGKGKTGVLSRKAFSARTCFLSGCVKPFSFSRFSGTAFSRTARNLETDSHLFPSFSQYLCPPTRYGHLMVTSYWKPAIKGGDFTFPFPARFFFPRRRPPSSSHRHLFFSRTRTDRRGGKNTKI